MSCLIKPKRHPGFVFVLIFSLFFHSFPSLAAEDDIELDEGTKLQEIVLTPEQGDAYVEQVIQTVLKDPKGIEGHVIDVLHLGSENDPNLVRILKRLDRAGIKVRGTVLTEEEFSEAVEQYRSTATNVNVNAVLARQDMRGYGRKAMDWVKGWFSPRSVNRRIDEFQDELYSKVGKGGITILEHFYETNFDGSLQRDENGKAIPRFADQASQWKKTGAIGAAIATVVFSSVMIYGGMKPWASLGSAAHLALCDFILGAWVYTMIRYAPQVTSFKSQWQVPYWDTSREAGEQFVVSSDETNSRAAYLSATVIQELLIVALLLPAIIGPTNVTWWEAGKGALNGLLTAFSHLFPEQLRATFLARAEKHKELNQPDLVERFNFLAVVVTHAWFNLLFPFFKNMNLLLSGDMASGSDWIAAAPLLIAGVLGAGVEIFRNWKRIRQAFGRFISAFNPFRRKKDCPTLLIIRPAP